jgi:FlaA1/EpsC-like NDP-sugar epimerase
LDKQTTFNVRALLVFAHDVVASGLAWGAAFWLRFNLEASIAWLPSMMKTLVWVVPVQAAIFLLLGLYRGIWRYASLPDLKRILVAVGLAALSVPLALVMHRLTADVPRSVFLLAPILLAGLMCGSRLAYRAWKEHRRYGTAAKSGEPVLVLGAGDAAFNLVKELARSQEWRVLGLLDDNRAKMNRVIHNAKVIGTLADAPRLARLLGVNRAIIAMPSASAAARRKAIDICTTARLSMLTVPAFDDLVSGRVTISQVRKVEVEDLLGREPITLDEKGLREILSKQVVMITGAGGSIGSELCRQIARFEPTLLVFFEASEFALYQIEQEFARRYPNIRAVCVSGDIKDRIRVGQVFAQFRPSVVFHAAAYKHVPLMETVNAWEAVRNNVLGTYVVAQAAIAHQVGRFVLISTDKAVNPVNVMGATKRLAEMVCQALQAAAQTRFAIVRFGNVLGSNGSVIPKFHDQISKGGPVTVTHPEVIRYFMSIPEAAQLVLQAGAMSVGGEIFVMDMGEPVKIVDLARDMIRLSGFSEDEIIIEFTGLRPGEKLFEEVLADDEHTLRTPHPKLRVAKAKEVNADWLVDLLEWLKSTEVRDDDHVRRDLKRWVPEYEPQRTSLRVVRGQTAGLDDARARIS